MANYYTKYSVTVGMTNEQLKRLAELIAQEAEERDDVIEFYGNLEHMAKDEEVWLYGTSLTDLDITAAGLSKYLEEVDSPERVIITFANICDEMRPDGFSGGAVMVEAGNYEMRNAESFFDVFVPERPGEQDFSIPERLSRAAAQIDEASKQLDEDDLAQEELSQMVWGLKIIHDGFEGRATESYTIEING